MIEAQNKIKSVVDQYKKFYPDEYSFVVKQVARNRTHGNKYVSDTIDRPLTEVPETLFGLFQRILSEGDIQYYASKEGTRWFGKTFPEFLRTEKV